MNAFTSENNHQNITGGFEKQPIVISEISDSVDLSDLYSLNKLGSSIPTPFARLNFFNAAFRHVNEVLNNPLNPIPHTDNSNSHKLVSLCIDMLEFIYKYGDSKDFKIVKWDKVKQIAELKKTSFGGVVNERHTKFAEALDFAFPPHYGQSLYLFYYKDELIGGSSPYTFVYTSPNQRKTYPGLKGQNLFDVQKPLALHERAEEFKEYMHKLRKTYANLFAQGTLRAEFGKYISDSLARENQGPLVNRINSFAALDQNTKLEQLNNCYKQLADENKNCYNFQPQPIPIFVKDNSNVKFNSGYHILPTTNIVVEKMPLALSDAGCDGCPYIDNSYWIPGSLTPAGEADIIANRTLPNSEINWPYVTANDFLQDKVIEVAFNINGTKFYSGSQSKVNFLVPLKREFFRYFRPEDISNMMTLRIDRNAEDEVVAVNVSLVIPIQGGNVIFTKTYNQSAGEIVAAWDGTATFDFALFPFFKDAVGANNKYQLMLGYNMPDITLGLYSLDALDEELQPLQNEGVGQVGAILQKERSKDKFKTRHYSINRAFDIIEVRIGDSIGLALPKMTQVDSSIATEKFTFCIDFGTTNTHIAYSNDNSGNVFPLTVEYGQDEQVVYLNDHVVQDGIHLTEGGFESAAIFLQKLKQEFVMPQIKRGILPMNTVLCEKKKLDADPKLFSSMNVAFYPSDKKAKLISQTDDNTYVDNLKWGTNDLARKRMKQFFIEMLMLMKHKSILNGGGVDFNVVVTYPQAMQGIVKSTFQNTWKDAAMEVGLQSRQISFEYESVTPYYSFSRAKALTEPYMNVDVGGGTIDILYHNPKTKDCLTYSVEFASNDIWGDGCNTLVKKGENGILSYYELKKGWNDKSAIPLGDDSLESKYQTIKRQWEKSGSIINQLFKESRFDFSNIVCASKFIAIPILHFTSLIYFLALAIKRDDVSIPRYITFTGMGSKYIKMIADEENDIAKLINSILGYCLDDKCTVKVMFAENPKEVTAEGGVAVNMAKRQRLNIITPISSNVIGLKDEDCDAEIKVKEVVNGKYRDEVLGHYISIVELLETEDFRRTLNSISKDYYDSVSFVVKKIDIKTILKNSFDAYTENEIKPRYTENMEGYLAESMFFWPLKNGLYNIGVELYEMLPKESLNANLEQ